ncbi:MAG TPA: hypothetical protein VN794_04885, partial [Methylomirabilota bacterium]|nr:hypothetical protein [Methylomirabilota bacterium]
MAALIQTPRWLLLAAIVFAPWAFGSTRDWASTSLAVLLCLLTALWLAACGIQRRWPEVPRVAAAAVLALLAIGWWMAANSSGTFDSLSLQLTHARSFAPGGPGSVDGPASFKAMLLTSGLAGSFLFSCELHRSS